MDPETLRLLRVAHCPGYAPAWRMHLIRKAEHLDADSLALSEAYKVAGSLSGRPTYAGVVWHSHTDTRAVSSPMGDAGDTPLLVHRHNRITHEWTALASAPGKPEKFAPERWVSEVTYEWHRQAVTHVTVHPVPLFCGRLVWVRTMRMALRRVRRANRLGHLVVLTGDLQTASKSLARLLRLAGLVVHREGIDYLCHNRRLTLVGDLEVVQQPQFDHPWLVANLRLATP